MEKTKKKHTLLKGEGANQHTLYGEFMVEDTAIDFADVIVTKDSLLKHEEPNGSFGEHQTLKVENGLYSMGKQVEYNPFTGMIERIWD